MQKNGIKFQNVCREKWIMRNTFRLRLHFIESKYRIVRI